jgi:hypothetical protein
MHFLTTSYSQPCIVWFSWPQPWCASVLLARASVGVPSQVGMYAQSYLSDWDGLFRWNNHFHVPVVASLVYFENERRLVMFIVPRRGIIKTTNNVYNNREGWGGAEIDGIVILECKDQIPLTILARQQCKSFCANWSLPILSEIKTKSLASFSYALRGLVVRPNEHFSIYPHISCWELSSIFDLEGHVKVSRAVVNRDATNRGLLSNANPRPFYRGGKSELSIGYFGLDSDDAGLSPIYISLSAANGQKRQGKEYLDQVRCFEIVKRFRGVPEAIGWFFAFALGCLLIARESHRHQSVLLGILAVCFLATAVFGPFIIILWLNFSDYASASHGTSCVSAQPYGRAEDVGIVPIVIPKFEFRNIKRQVFTADFVEAAHNPRALFAIRRPLTAARSLPI